MKLQQDFFDCDCVCLARKLLGKVLCVRHGGETLKKIITETEAYGTDDTACHCRHGRTARNDPMFCRGGTVYVYLCYGIHEILNFSAGADGEGQGVMIRGVFGATGPGKVTKALYIGRDFNYETLPNSPRIWIEDTDKIPDNADNQSNKALDTADAQASKAPAPTPRNPSPKIQELKRVGIGYASQRDQDRLWRFRIDYD